MQAYDDFQMGKWGTKTHKHEQFEEKRMTGSLMLQSSCAERSGKETRNKGQDLPPPPAGPHLTRLSMAGSH